MKKLGFFTKLMTFLFLAFVIVMVGLYTYAYFSPKLELSSIGQMYIYYKDDALVYQGSGSSECVDLEDISTNVIQAVLSVEDKNFYKHQGFDYLRIAKAMALNIKNKKIVQGASTISQQYIKNINDLIKNNKNDVDKSISDLSNELNNKIDDVNNTLVGSINN